MADQRDRGSEVVEKSVGGSAGGSDGDDDRAADREPTGRGRRSVVVPVRIYKTVTVLSTLIAVVGVVLGFTLLDAATLERSLVRIAVIGGLGAVGLRPESGTVSALLAALGLGTIAFGAAVYILGTRFRSPAIENAQDVGDERAGKKDD